MSDEEHDAEKYAAADADARTYLESQEAETATESVMPESPMSPSPMSSSPSPEGPVKPLAVLSPVERVEVNTQRRLIQDARKQLEMLQGWHSLLWRSIMEKYDLPSNVIYQEEGGIVMPSNGDGHG